MNPRSRLMSSVEPRAGLLIHLLNDVILAFSPNDRYRDTGAECGSKVAVGNCCRVCRRVSAQEIGLFCLKQNPVPSILPRCSSNFERRSKQVMLAGQFLRNPSCLAVLKSALAFSTSPIASYAFPRLS